MPGGLHARLCHTFPVAAEVQRRKISRHVYCISNDRNEFAELCYCKRSVAADMDNRLTLFIYYTLLNYNRL